MKVVREGKKLRFLVKTVVLLMHDSMSPININTILLINLAANGSNDKLLTETFLNNSACINRKMALLE